MHELSITRNATTKGITVKYDPLSSSQDSDNSGKGNPSVDTLCLFISFFSPHTKRALYNCGRLGEEVEMGIREDALTWKKLGRVEVTFYCLSSIT